MRPLRRRDLSRWLLAATASTAEAATPLRLRFPAGRDANDARDSSVEDLLALLLRAVGRRLEVQRVPGLTQPRRLIELQAGRLDVAIVSSVSPLLSGLRVLRQPLRRGLLGLRLILTRPERAPGFAKLRQLDELRRWRLGYGADWADLPQMQALGLDVVPVSSYSGMFRMLEQGRIDWMHRGVNEVWAELDHPTLVPSGLVVVPDVALFFPLDDYFCVSPHHPELLPLLEQGFARVLQDGRYAQWFRQHFGRGLERAGLAQRQVLNLAGYGVPPGTPLQAFDALRLAPARGELVLP